MKRLDKFLSDSGAGTRSQVRAMLRAGRVTVDGVPEQDGGRRIDPDAQAVLLDGHAVSARQRTVLMLNKPAGYVTATEDAAEQTVMALLPPAYQNLGLKPIGRLDKQTEGLLLFTDDGALLHKLIAPKNRVPKVYYARHAGTAGAEDVAAFAAGLTLADGTRCLPAELTPLAAGESLVTVCEGKYHQVRRMLASRGLRVTYLERRAEGALTLASLPRGAVRELTAGEIALLMATGTSDAHL